MTCCGKDSLANKEVFIQLVHMLFDFLFLANRQFGILLDCEVGSQPLPGLPLGSTQEYSVFGKDSLGFKHVENLAYQMPRYRISRMIPEANLPGCSSGLDGD